MRRRIRRALRQKRKRLAPRWYRAEVGGRWDEIGRLQFDFLVSRGLTPASYLLDVGCGSLRGGLHFIRFLDPGHYYGIDARRDLIDAGIEHELKPSGLEARNPHLEVMNDFAFGRLGRRFDFALAVSVFTHLPVNSIERCLIAMEEALVQGGSFFATFFENDRGRTFVDPVHRKTGPNETITTYMDRDPFHYRVRTFEHLVEGSSLELTYIGDWGHPRGQQMLCFTKR